MTRDGNPIVRQAISQNLYVPIIRWIVPENQEYNYVNFSIQCSNADLSAKKTCFYRLGGCGYQVTAVQRVASMLGVLATEEGAMRMGNAS